MSLPEPSVTAPPRNDQRAHEAGGSPETERPDGAGPERWRLTLPQDRSLLAERAAWSLVWLGIMAGGLGLTGSWWSWPAIDVLAPALVAVALVGLVLCWCTASPRSWFHQGLALAGALASVAAPQIVRLHTRIYYPTDAAALDHVAARVLADGHNPYTTSLSSAGSLLDTASQYWTYTVSGGHITSVSYPAGSFLVYAPAFALGFHHEVVDWMDLYAWLASCVLLFLLVPRFLRWLAVLVALSGIFIGQFAGGGTDAMFVPLAMLAVWRWDRYGRGREAGVASWLGPIALGLACSIKQTVWFCVPFLAVGIYLEIRRSGRSPWPVVGRYVAVVVAVFAAVNLPFIIWSAGAWWHGTLIPLAQPLIADGSGLVTIALHGITGGVDLTTLTYASGLAYLATLVAFVVWYPWLKRIWLLLLPVAFFFSPRSFASYLVDLFPVAVLAVVTVEGATRSLRSRAWGRLRAGPLAVGALALGTAVASAVAFTSAPLALEVRHATVGTDHQHLKNVTVTVTNGTGSKLFPQFMVDVGQPHPTGFWTTAGNQPVVVAPHGSVTVTLFPPSPTYLPPFAANWVVGAYTQDPRALSTSPDVWHNDISELPKH